jgi:hypothetical protein
VDRYSFLVRLFHPQLHAGLPRRTVNYFFWSTTIISPDQRQLLLTSSAGAKRRRGRGAKPARVWCFPSFLSSF